MGAEGRLGALVFGPGVDMKAEQRLVEQQGLRGYRACDGGHKGHATLRPCRFEISDVLKTYRSIWRLTSRFLSANGRRLRCYSRTGQKADALTVMLPLG
jgi:hypothetical protein